MNFNKLYQVKMKCLSSVFVLFLIFMSISTLNAQTNTLFKIPTRGITSSLPATIWENSLITGNGTMGALVMGQPYKETVILSHAKLYIPLNKPKRLINQASRLTEIQTLLLEGRYMEAAKIPAQLRDVEGFNIGIDPYIPAFDIRIEQPILPIKNYLRTVNYETGEANVNWEDSNGTFKRTVFVSRPDSVIVLSIKGTGKINCSIRFDHRPIEAKQAEFVSRGIENMQDSASGQWLTYRSEFKNKYTGGLEGYEGVGKIVLKGGKAKVEQGKLVISQADEVLLLVKINPSYNYSTSQIPLLKAELSAKSINYDELLARHAQIHGELFNRSKLNLGGADSDRVLSSEALLSNAKKQVSFALIEKVYDAGRYNIISAMGTNPPNLQGIWSGTWTAPWSSGFTHDGNVQTAISSVLSSNMPELMMAYTNYHERNLAAYRENARLLFGTKGIHVPASTSTIGMDTDFGEIWCLSLWTGGAGWTANSFYDYYLYTGDQKFLAEHAYPFMKESAQFYQDFLKPGKDGKLIFNPSYSPENNPSNETSQATINATMDVMIARQLLRNCITAAGILKIDEGEIDIWKKMLLKLPKYKVAPDGTLCEWLWPDLEQNHKHRHSSHLYALFDAQDTNITNYRRLVNAVNRTIDEKMKFRIEEDGGEMSFGLVQLGLAAAHIGEGEKANQIVKWLSSKYWSTGMGSYHNVGNLFNTDISGGLPAVIIQMLAYSERGLVSLIPALPKEWSKGTIEGLLLRGHILVKSLSWNGKHVEVVLKSAVAQNIDLKFPRSIESISVEKIKKVEYPVHPERYMISLPAEKEVKVVVDLE